MQTLFLLYTLKKMFGSFSSCPDVGKKTSFWGQGVTPRILSNARDSTINLACSILGSLQKTGDYTYFTPGPSQKNLAMSPLAIPCKQLGLEMYCRYIYLSPKDYAGRLEDKNYNSLYPPQNLGTCEYYISFILYVTKYLLIHLFHTQYIPQL